MKIIFAGNTGVAKREKRMIHKKTPRLFSYHFVKDNLFNSFEMMKLAMGKVELFLDSGAFSAWSQGAEIDIKEYVKFIKENKDAISIYANLDVIGSPEGTLKNQRIMEKAGLSPLPVFHYGEDPEKYLKPLIEKYDYICIGGMVKSGDLIPFLDRIFLNYICDEHGMPKVKIHGFGLTSLTLMLRYPWYSVDSTSWVVTGRMGSIFVPKFKQGKWIYDENPWKIAVSNQSPSRKEANQHIDTFSPSQKKIILDYIHEKGYQLGKSRFKEVEQSHELQENEKWAQKKPANKNDLRLLEIIETPGIANKYQLRDEMNIIYYLDLEKSMPAWPWPFKIKQTLTGLF